MKLPLRHSLVGRLLLLTGVATFLPMVLLMTVVLAQVYRATSEQTFATIEQTSARYASEFAARLNAKVALMAAFSAVSDHLEDRALVQGLLEADLDIRDAWVRREGVTPEYNPAHRQILYEQVRSRGVEVLSEPNFARNEASLGVPMVSQGRFVGMVAVSFSLKYFQEVVTGVHLLKTGYALLVSHHGSRVAHPEADLIGVRIGNDLHAEAASALLRKVDAGVSFSFEKAAILTGKWSHQYYSAVQVGRAGDPWFFVVVAPTDEVTQDLNNLFLVLIAGILVTLALVGAVTWVATRSVVRPLQELAAGAEAVAAGQHDTRVPWRSHDEVGVLANSFNHMTDQLVQALEDQEAEVEQRTASLQKSLEDLAQAQEKIVDSEKLAVLGQLMASIAHDINTPLGAIRSSASFLFQRASARAGNLPDFYRSLDEESLILYKALVAGKEVNLAMPSGGEDRKRRRDLAQRLRDLKVEEPEDLADDIVFLVPAGEEAPLVQAIARGQALVIRQAAQAAAFIQSSAIILEAADRAASTVSALVDYSRSPDLDTDQLVEPAKELETILTLYYGVSRRGVVITRDFEPGLTLQGDRDRLNQVWVNLLNNAFQAMNYRGRLVLRTRRAGDAVEVSVANNGPKIPDGLREKIFQPFFTTKKAGEGTGLGLDICRKIVEAHGGALVLSEEGEFTVFTVRLPHSPHPERSFP